MSLYIQNDLIRIEFPLDLVQLEPVQAQEYVRNVISDEAADLHSDSIDVGSERNPALAWNLRTVGRPDLAPRPLNLSAADKARRNESNLTAAAQ